MRKPAWTRRRVDRDRVALVDEITAQLRAEVERTLNEGIRQEPGGDGYNGSLSHYGIKATHNSYVYVDGAHVRVDAVHLLDWLTRRAYFSRHKVPGDGTYYRPLTYRALHPRQRERIRYKG